MNREEPHILTEAEADRFPALRSYLSALDHLAPGCVRLQRAVGSAEGSASDPWSAALPVDEEVWQVRVTPPERKRDAPLFWREPVILRMLAAMAQNLSGKRPLTEWPQGVRAAWSLITRHPSRAMSLGEVASCLKLSAGYLGARIEQVLGSTFRCLLRDERVALACRLLLGTDLQISEIAGRLGGQSLSQFNRNFAAATGESPRAYRARYGGGQQNGRIETLADVPRLSYC